MSWFRSKDVVLFLRFESPAHNGAYPLVGHLDGPCDVPPPFQIDVGGRRRRPQELCLSHGVESDDEVAVALVALLARYRI